MSLVAENIHVGPMRIFLDVTNPATGLPPTAHPHTAGVPTPGVEIGYTEGDATFRKNKETFEINAEQATGPVGVGLVREIVEIEFTALEKTYRGLQTAFDNSGSSHPAGRMIFYGGGSTFPIKTQSVFFSSLRPNQAGKYETATIYKAYNVAGYETTFRKSAASMFRITLRGLSDSSRALGDQMYQYVIEEP
jgi:hypothetical protein